ncbi:MAG: hypothetical protein ACRDOY_07565 [Nocardioidaceae bacterium]
MTERARLEDRQRTVHADLQKASRGLESSLETLTEFLGTGDAARITAAKDAMQTCGETVRSLTEEQTALQRRLEHLTTKELTRGAINAARSSARTAWATFWVAMFAMIASTTATIMAAVVASSQ